MLFAPVANASETAAPLASKGGFLVCNEPRKAHRAVLEDMLLSFLPQELVQRGGCTAITQFEASPASSSTSQSSLTFRRFMPFDKVLVCPPLGVHCERMELL